MNLCSKLLKKQVRKQNVKYYRIRLGCLHSVSSFIRDGWLKVLIVERVIFYTVSVKNYL